MVLGDLRYSILVIGKTITKDEYGAESVVWSNKLQLRANRKFISGDRTLDNKEVFNSKRVIFTTHYRDVISEDDRIIFRDEKYLIKSISEIGFKEGLQIDAELIND